MTLFVAIVAFLYLPNSPMEGGRSLLGHIVLKPKQAEILSRRVLTDDPQKAYARGTTVSISDIKDTFLDWRLYGHCASAFLSS